MALSSLQPLSAAIARGLHEPPIRSRGPAASAAALSAALALGTLAPLGELQAATIDVDTTADVAVSGDGDCSLREAIYNANNGGTDFSGGDCTIGDVGLDTIQFDPALTGSTITVNTGQLVSIDDLALTGPGRDDLYIDGNGSNRILAAYAPLTVSGLTFQAGDAGPGYGGAIFATEGLTVSDSRFRYNRAGHGGALATPKYYGQDTQDWLIQNTEFFGNVAELYGGINQPKGGPPPFASGGAIMFAQRDVAVPGSLTIDGSDFFYNSAEYSKYPGVGGAVAVFGFSSYGPVSLQVTNSVVERNFAVIGGGVAGFSESITVDASAIDRNIGAYGGGALLVSKYYGGGAGDVTISSSYFRYNLAYEAAGGRVGADNVQLTDVTVTGNSTVQIGLSGPGAPKGISAAYCPGPYGPQPAGEDVGGLGVFGSTITIDGNSLFADNCAGYDAGGLEIDVASGGALTIASTVQIRDNLAGSEAGGLDLYLYGNPAASATIAASILGNTAATGAGGGLFVDLEANATLILDGATISGNSAGSAGGGLFVAADSDGYGGTALSPSLTIANSLVSTNTAAGRGGGIGLYGDGRVYLGAPVNDFVAAGVDLTISNSELSGNTAGSAGGGLHLYGRELGDIAVLDSTIAGNTATPLYSGRGGGIALEFSGSYRNVESLLISGTTISGNTAGGAGGGLFMNPYAGDQTVVNSTFSGNTTLDGETGGGGIHVAFGTPMILLSTITGNSAPGDTGGGIDIDGGPVTLRNAIVANNTALDGGPDIFGSVDADFTLIEDPSGATITGGNNLNGDPALGPLADNGGLTLTHLPTTGSPVVDAGDPAFAPPPATDQRGAGFPRVQGAVVDMGSVEGNPQVTALTIAPDPFAEGTSATLTVTMNGTTGSDVTVTVDFSGEAVLGTDFSAGDDDPGTAGIQVVIPAGSASGDITLSAIADGIDENDEAFTADVGAVSGPASEAGTVQDSATITDADPAPALSIDDISVGESAGPARFTVTRTGGSESTITVDFATSDGSAIAGSDYTAASGTLSFPPGAGTQAMNIDVTILDDTVDEPDETFNVDLSNAANATIADAQGVGTIVDDEAAPTVTLMLTNASFPEDGGSTDIVATLSGPSGQPVTVTLGFSGTATFGTDYTVSDDDPGTPGIQIVIPAGATSGTVTLTALSDTVDDPDESVVVEITSVANGTEAGQQVATGVIAGGGTGGPGAVPQPTVIPTLSEWMLMILGLLLPATVMARLRRRERRRGT